MCIRDSLIQVKGKTVPVRIFALIGNNEVQSSDWFKEFNPIHAELISEYRNQNWENASSLSQKARRVAGEKYDSLYDLFDERIAEYQINPPGEDWDGVYIATDK